MCSRIQDNRIGTPELVQPCVAGCLSFDSFRMSQMLSRPFGTPPIGSLWAVAGVFLAGDRNSCPIQSTHSLLQLQRRKKARYGI